MTGPLEGIRIIDLTTVISGPMATCYLADQGADVIKVEAREGDISRALGPKRGTQSAMFITANRNKR
ncbi:MAG: CoA transferase, partial [Pseudomonadota bacterium]